MTGIIKSMEESPLKRDESECDCGEAESCSCAVERQVSIRLKSGTTSAFSPSPSPPTAPAGSPLAGTAAGGTFPRVMENKVLMSFAFYSTILILKMYVVAIITGQVRLRKKAFANPEDALRNGGLQYHREDPDVERCRRRVRGPWELLRSSSGKLKDSLIKAHRNDMENIFPFLFLGAIYSLLDPSPAVARIHFFIFCVGRIVHTVAYLLKLKAPTRSVAYSCLTAVGVANTGMPAVEMGLGGTWSPAAQGEFEGSGVAAAGNHVWLQREPSWENERME
ncbi:Ptges [Columba livia]|nr:Ptges [Columba livia]